MKDHTEFTFERRKTDAPLTSEAEQVLKSLVSAPPPAAERRGSPRQRYNRNAVLRVRGEAKQASVFTRDIHDRATGFVTSADVSNVDGATLHLPGPDGNDIVVHCRVRRARPVGKGWFEGVLEFSTPIALFSETRISS